MPPKRDTNFTDIGVAGRKTGVTILDTGHRDELGMEPLSGFFSSPAKTPAPPSAALAPTTMQQQPQVTSSPAKLSMSMDLVTTTSSTPARLNRDRASLPPRARSPAKTTIGGTPARRAASVGLSTPATAEDGVGRVLFAGASSGAAESSPALPVLPGVTEETSSPAPAPLKTKKPPVKRGGLLVSKKLPAQAQKAFSLLEDEPDSELDLSGPGFTEDVSMDDVVAEAVTPTVTPAAKGRGKAAASTEKKKVNGSAKGKGKKTAAVVAATEPEPEAEEEPEAEPTPKPKPAVRAKKAAAKVAPEPESEADTEVEEEPTPKPKAANRGRKTTTKASAPEPEPEPEADEDPEVEEVPEPTPKPKAAAIRGRKPRAAIRPEPEADEEEAEDPTPKRKGAARGRKKLAKTADPDPEPEPEPEPAAKPKNSRLKKTAKAPEPEPEVEEKEEETAPRPKNARAKKQPATKTAAPEPEPETESDPAPKPKGRGKKTTKAVEPEAEPEAKVEEEPVSKPASKGRGKAAAKTIDNEAEAESDPAPTKGVRGKKATKATKAAEPEVLAKGRVKKAAQAAENSEDSEPTTTRNRRGGKKAASKVVEIPESPLESTQQATLQSDNDEDNDADPGPTRKRSKTVTKGKGKAPAAPAKELSPELQSFTPRSKRAAAAAATRKGGQRITAHPPPSRATSVEAVAGSRRSTRATLPPLAFWKGEKVVYQLDGNRNKNSIAMPTIAEVIRVESDSEDNGRRPAGTKRKRPAVKSAKRGAAAEESDPEEEDWETRVVDGEIGVVRGYVKTFRDRATADADEEELEERELAFSRNRIVTVEVANGDFTFVKTCTEEFFGTGMVEIPPGGVKRTKNSGKMHLVFYVIEGKVSVKIRDNEFRVRKGAQFMVPRGNLYSIENPYDFKAKMFFAQGCEKVVSGSSGGSDEEEEGEEGERGDGDEEMED